MVAKAPGRTEALELSLECLIASPFNPASCKRRKGCSRQLRSGVPLRASIGMPYIEACSLSSRVNNEIRDFDAHETTVASYKILTSYW